MSTIASISPDSSIGKVGEVEVSSHEEVLMSVASAKNAFSMWSKLPMSERKAELEKLYTALSENSEGLAKSGSAEMGMPIEESKIDLESGLGYFRWYLDNFEKYLSPEVSFENEKELHKVYYEPVGVVAVIMPWNFPFSNFIWGVIPNLLAGNSVVFKHSEEVIVTSKKYQEIVAKCNLPEGILNFVYGAGEVGDQLVHADINMICFTGSTKTGKYLYSVAAEKLIKVVLELGGSAPAVVFEDANLDTVVETVYINRFGNCGQICDGLKRLIIHESIAEQFTEKMKAKLEALKVGNPLEEDTNIGPLVAERQLTLLESQVNESVNAGATVVIGGKRRTDLNGVYYAPTILSNVARSMRVWAEEVFGPVLPVVTFKTYEEAIMLANDTVYGLGGYVFSENPELAQKAARDINTGMVTINGAFYVIPSDPFGGNKQSGIGREHGAWGLRELTNPKVIAAYK